MAKKPRQEERHITGSKHDGAYGNTIESGNRHRCLFSKLAATIGAYIRKVPIFVGCL